MLIGDKYRLEHLLGEGGMGSVWAATNVALDATVAIKLIRDDENRDDLSLRLVQEARAAARLGHPAIVRVFDVGRTNRGDPFIVMERLEGETFQDRLTREWRLGGIDAVKVLLPIAEALCAAHAKGITHRDIKPENVFLAVTAENLQPKLVDFGIAKFEQRDVQNHATQRGMVVGSPEYMSPEQARGADDVDYRSDIWSFCVVLYRAISGRTPFEGANYNALLRSIVEDEPRSIREFLGGDEELAQLIEIGMAKDRALRFRSMEELGLQLAQWLLRRGVFEDAAGASLDSRWLNRNSSSRVSRSSFASLPSIEVSQQLGMAVTQVYATPSPPPLLSSQPAKARRRLARLVVPLVLGVGAVLALLAARSTASDTRIVAVPPDDRREQAPLSRSEIVPVPAAPAVATAASAPSSSVAPAAKSAARRQQDRAAKPASSAKSAGGKSLDLMKPY